MQEISVIINSDTDENYYKTFQHGLGEILTKARQQQNMRLEALSKQINVNLKTLEKVELGRRHAHFVAISRLLTLYKKRIQISLIDEND